MGKYGRKHVISDDPLDYNVGVIGESGIGKSTLMFRYAEKVAGENGYIVLDVGKEDGHDAINGIVSEPVRDWSMFADVVKDIIENKETDYPELRLVVIDTFDELCTMAEPEIIRRWNDENKDKRDFTKATSIKACYGGFQGGEKQAISMILDALWSLKGVGVAFAITGHTKTREITDPVTNESFSMLTTNADKFYFNAIRTKLHLLGVASIDRDIIRQKTGKKNLKTGADILKGKVVSESRIITFRDDNYTIDSKSRFSQIVDQIPLDADALVKAMRDAIAKEKDKSTPEEDLIIETIATITEKAKALFAAGYDREKFYEAVVSVCGTRQFNKLEDIKLLKAVLDTVNKMEA